MDECRPGEAKGTITFKTAAEKRNMLCFLAKQQADTMRALGESELVIARRIAHGAVGSRLSRARPITKGLLRTVRADVRACLRYAVNGWWLLDMVQDPEDCAGVHCKIVNFDPNKKRGMCRDGRHHD